MFDSVSNANNFSGYLFEAFHLKHFGSVWFNTFFENNFNPNPKGIPKP